MKEQNMNQVELMNGELDEAMLEDVNGGCRTGLPLKILIKPLPWYVRVAKKFLKLL